MAELLEMVVGSGRGSSMDDADSNIEGTLSPEPLERHEPFFPHNYEQLRPGTNMTSYDDSMVPEVMQEVEGQLTAGFQSSNASHILDIQGGYVDQVSTNMASHQQVPTRLPPQAPVHLIRAIWTMSFFTLVPAIRAALYKPARGVVFGDNKIAYYLALSAIVASGLGEATMAFLLSRPGGGSRRCVSIGRTVLCASILPFMAIHGIARYGLMEN
ncbi:hypothetical protein ACQ4PT_038777 [Festuca glaucescens]